MAIPFYGCAYFDINISGFILKWIFICIIFNFLKVLGFFVKYVYFSTIFFYFSIRNFHFYFKIRRIILSSQMSLFL